MPKKLSTVSNAIKILLQFSGKSPELGITELSNRLGLTKSAIFRIVYTLCEENILQKNNKSRKYRLWLPVFEIGSVLYHDLDICQAASPFIKVMTKNLPGVIHLVVYDRGSVVFLLKFPEEKETVLFNNTGKRIPAYCLASGKVLLAFQDQKEINRVLESGLESFTKNTITSVNDIRHVLSAIRDQKYGISKEEFRNGITSIATPIFNDTNKIVAAISLTGSSSLFSSTRIQHTINELKTYSRLISGNMA